MMAETCRACGRENRSEGIPFQDFQSQAGIFFELTSVQLHQHENPDLLKLCQVCVDMLAEFDHFREKCCRVHWDLLKVKTEPEDYIDLRTLVVEQNAQSNQDNDGENYKYLVEIPCMEMFLETSDEITKNDVSSEEDEDYVTLDTLKKARAKYDSLKKPPKPEPYSCDHCSKMFQDRLLLIAHVRRHAGLVPYYCEICQRDFTTLLDVKRHHVKKHTQPKTVTCDESDCEKEFESSQALRNHKLRNHDPAYTEQEETTSSSDQESSTSGEEATKKRKPKEKKESQSSVQRRRRIAGKSYLRTDNVRVKAKTFPRQFKCGCPKKCWTKFESDGILKQFFKSFWNSGDLQKQNALLVDHSKPVEVTQHRDRGSKNPRSERKVTFHYFIPSEQEKVRVCLKYFLGILQINSGRMRKGLGR